LRLGLAGLSGLLAPALNKSNNTMSLERKDIRAKLDPDNHAQLRAICDIEGVDMGDWIEAVLKPVIEKRVHDAIELASRLHRLGTSGSGRESAGVAGNRRESPGTSGSDRE
jgi:hypothetical protein